MEKVTAYRFRGVLYDEEKVVKVIDECIGNILTRHAHQLARLDKYSAIVDYLEVIVDDFHEIHLLRQDLKIATGEDS